MSETAPQLSEGIRKSVTSSDLPEIYVNGFQIAIGPMDVRIFLIVTSPVNPGEVQDRKIASLIMTPETLKLLSENLPAFVTAYESTFGKIRTVPTTAQAALQAAMKTLEGKDTSKPEEKV